MQETYILRKSFMKYMLTLREYKKEEKDQVWLKAGDLVTVEIEGIGALENRLV